MKFIVTLVVVALAVVFQGPFAASYAVNASGHCTGLTVTDFLSSDHRDQTSSTGFVNITDGRLNFVTSAPGCVIITFSASASVSSLDDGFYDLLHVRTLLDGTSNCAPGVTSDIFLSARNPAPGSSNSITRICPKVAAGVHTVQVQYRNESGGAPDGGSADIVGHILTINHN